MKFGRTGIVVLIIGVATGAMIADGLRAQPTPPAFLIAEIEVTNPEAYKAYAAQAPSAAVEPFGGRYLVRAGVTDSLEGETPKRMIVISFPSVDAAKRWYQSPAYAKIRPLRQQAAKSREFIVEGLPN